MWAALNGVAFSIVREGMILYRFTFKVGTTVSERNAFAKFNKLQKNNSGRS